MEESLVDKESLCDPVATGKVDPFWEQYVEGAEKYDDAFLKKNKIRVEGVLLFSGLFSTVTITYLTSMQSTLQPNPSDTTNALLMMVTHSLNNSALSDQSLVIPKWNGPAYSSVVAQALGYAALATSLLASLGAVLGNQWLSNSLSRYATSKTGSFLERGSKRQQRLDALEKWWFEGFMETLPALIQLALLLFGVSLSIALWELNRTVGYVVMSMTGFGVLFYLFFTVASLCSPTCPFHTPLSSTVQETMVIATKSVEEITGYWEWCFTPEIPKPTTTRVNKTLAYLLPLLIIIFVMPIMVLFCCICVLVIVSIPLGEDFRTQMGGFLKKNFCSCARVVRTYARSARDSIRWTYQDPVPELDRDTPRAVSWLLRTSSRPEKLIPALELVPTVKWPEDFDLSILGEGPHNFFARLILEIRSLKGRALPLGKALVVLLCRVPLSVHSSYKYIWEETVEQLDDIIQKQMVDWSFDIIFTLAIFGKLLRIKLGSEDHGPDLPRTGAASQDLLVWLLGLLETMLRLDHSHASKFFPEASQLYLRLDLRKAKLSTEQQVQYCRTFETFFNFALDFEVETMNVPANLPAISRQSGCLQRILRNLRNVDPSRLSDVQGHLIVILDVLSKLTSTQGLRAVIKGAAINQWVVMVFREAVSGANENEEGTWRFVGSLVQLAVDVDLFDLNGDTVQPAVDVDQRMDSMGLLSYLLNKQVPPTSERIVYALRAMLSNQDEHITLALDLRFIRYVLLATEPTPDQAASIRGAGLDVLTATCQSLLRTDDADSLLTLADDDDFARFLHRAILSQDRPTILSDLLRINDEDLNRNLLEKLDPVLDDPFDAVLTGLQNKPDTIPEHSLRELEIALVLSDDEGKCDYLFDYLDDYIDTMPSPDPQSQSPEASLLAAIVGWLLRRNGPTWSLGEIDWRVFLRPNFEKLLFHAWGDLNALRDKPQMLQLLLNCTEKWLSDYGYFGRAGSSERPPVATFKRLRDTVAQLSSGDHALPADIKRTLQQLRVQLREWDNLDEI